MWIYSQVTGELAADNPAISIGARGYSGAGAGKNNPDMEDQHNVGPIPVGFYTIEPPHTHPTLGPFVMNLEPDPANEMFGRSEFRLHGDSIHAPGTASHGCIILPRAVRENIWASNDHRLQVIHT